MNLTSPKEMGHDPEIEPAPNWQLDVILRRNWLEESRPPCTSTADRPFYPSGPPGPIHDQRPEALNHRPGATRPSTILRSTRLRPLVRLDHRPGAPDLRPEALGHRPFPHDHQPSTSRPEITRPATINHSSKVNHSQPCHDVNLVSNTKESKADPEHEPQMKSLEEEKQVATNVWNEPDCPTTRSRTKELKKIIGGMLQATAQLGDDISLGNSKEERPEPEHKPEEDKRQDEELGGIKDALLTPRTKKLKDQWKFAQRLIKAPVQPRAKPSTLVLIQA